ncbi:plasmid pRiA4b ORF-3 family protein [Desulfobacter latus]|uniref:Plasmid pRiA4b ORF-3 family protein n=1 Tax=Desulfobacter latus TaxID=2292 RepID=A0A850T4F3_9BACT|nr:plasmid pRiA4b ORF-3 family protein [Desulfobacter latus]NWH03715.1 plasmid pRiA4b ORF-3 family protein [Desulfobacter latus]
MNNGKNRKDVIWTLRVKLPLYESDCIRIFEIPSNANFLDLHEAIQRAVNFDNDHLFEFYIGRRPGHRAYPVGQEPEWETFNPDNVYKKIRISDVWPVPKGMKVFYLFDFGDNWTFHITKTRHKDKPVQPGVSYPRVIDAKGEAPEQYPDWDDDWEDE